MHTDVLVLCGVETLKPPSDIDVISSFLKYQTCNICSKVVGGHKSRSSSSSIVMVHWDKEYFGPSPV